MKILILTGEYPPYMGGGVGTFAYELANGLIKQGHEVIVITRAPIPREYHLSNDKIKMHYLASPQIPPKDIVYYITRMRDITGIVRMEKPEVIHDASAVTGYMPWITKLAPTVATVHGSPQLGRIRAMLGGEDRVRGVLFDIAHRLPASISNMFAKPDIKVWVHVSRFVLKDNLASIKDEKLREHIASRSRVIYNGIDIDMLRSIKDSVKNAEDGHVIYIGRLMEYKGVKFLIKAFKHVVEEVQDAMLHIVGDGPIYNDLMKLVERLELGKNVVMHGAMSRTDTMKLLARSQILTHPSLYESFGMVIAEAYAMGKPVITHRAGYAMELVEETGAGLTVNILNEKEYADAMIQLLTDKSLYRKLSQRALETSSLFSMENMIRSYVKVYQDAMVL